MIKDGFIPFGPYRTYYRIVGKPSDKAPLLLLHGGPGSTHNYFEALDELAERDQRQLIMYDQAEAANDFTGDAYQRVNTRFMELHAAAAPDENAPEYLWREKNVGELAYQTAWGPNEFTPTGNLKDYDYTAKLHSLYVPTLITSGTNDLCTPLVAKTMADALPNSQWHLFNGTRHMSFVEKPLEYQAVLQDWLDQHD